MDPDNVIGMVVPLLIILGIASAIFLGIYMVQAARRCEKQDFPTRTLFRMYLALLSVVGLALMVGGVGHLVNAGMSETLDCDFSYYPPLLRRRFRATCPDIQRRGAPEQAKQLPDQTERLERATARHRGESGLHLGRA